MSLENTITERCLGLGGPLHVTQSEQSDKMRHSGGLSLAVACVTKEGDDDDDIEASDEGILSAMRTNVVANGAI